MDTVRINKRSTKIVAHRGLSGIETENTVAAFVAAANRSYFGIECDMRTSKDGQLLILHDNTLERIAGVNTSVENENFDYLRSIKLFERGTNERRGDLVLATLDEYAKICSKYGKYSILEIKGKISDESLEKMISVLEKHGHTDKTIFISFNRDSVLSIRKRLPCAKVQFLCSEIDDALISWLKENNLDLDVYHEALNCEKIAKLHAAGIVVNCWTVDSKERAEQLTEWGIDYITTNILE